MFRLLVQLQLQPGMIILVLAFAISQPHNKQVQTLGMIHNVIIHALFLLNQLELISGMAHLVNGNAMILHVELTTSGTILLASAFVCNQQVLLQQVSKHGMIFHAHTFVTLHLQVLNLRKLVTNKSIAMKYGLMLCVISIAPIKHLAHALIMHRLGILHLVAVFVLLLIQ